MHTRHFARTFALAIALHGGASFAQNAPRPAAQPSAEALCTQGDEEQHDGDLTAARTHLEQGLARLGTADTPAARRTRLRCSAILSTVLESQGDRAAAWTRALEGWRAARTLPASAWAGYEPSYFEFARRIWSGPRCAASLDDAATEEAEVTVLQSLARGDSPGTRECLAAIRARLAQAHRGTCRALDAPPAETPAFTPSERSWTAIDPQTGVRADGGTVLVARVEGSRTRYVSCETTLSEAQVTPSGRWVVPGAVLAVTARILPCGEDTPAARCPAETLAWMLDGSGRLLGMYALRRSPLVDRGPLALPFGAVTSAAPFSAEGNAVRVGTRRLAVSQGALVAAP